MPTFHHPYVLTLFALWSSLYLGMHDCSAQETNESDPIDSLWESLEGEWIRYGGDFYQTKTITRGRLVFEGWTQMGEFRFRKTAKLELVLSGGIARFIESESKIERSDGTERTDDSIFEAPFKVANGVFWEVHRGIFVDRNQQPGITANRNTSSPGESLLIAARQGDSTRVTMLLDRGVDVDYTSQNTYTALGYAAGCGHLELVKFLLDQGADINKRARFTKTPLSVALEGGHLPVIRHLVESGAELHVRLPHGGGMVNSAVHWGHPPVLEYLLSRGLKAHDASPRNGWTPLHTAVHHFLNGPEKKRPRFAECARLLVANGANKNAKNDKGETPLSLYRAAKGDAAPFFD